MSGLRVRREHVNGSVWKDGSILILLVRLCGSGWSIKAATLGSMSSGIQDLLPWSCKAPFYGRGRGG